MGKTHKFTLTGVGVVDEMFKKGATVRFRYATSTVAAKSTRLPKRDEIDIVLYSTMLSPVMSGVRLFTGWSPKAAIKVTGGFAIASQKGWLLTDSGPQTNN